MLLNIMHHCCLVSYLESSLYFGVNEMISFQKLIGNLDMMIVANLDRQHQRFLDSYFKSSSEYSYLFGVVSYYFIPSILLKLVVCNFKLMGVMFLYNSLNNTTTLHHLSY